MHRTQALRRVLIVRGGCRRVGRRTEPVYWTADFAHHFRLAGEWAAEHSELVCGSGGYMCGRSANFFRMRFCYASANVDGARRSADRMAHRIRRYGRLVELRAGSCAKSGADEYGNLNG